MVSMFRKKPRANERSFEKKHRECAETPTTKGEQMSLLGLLMIAALAYMTCDVIGTAIEKNKERRGE